MIRAFFETFQRYKYLLMNLIATDFKIKYRRSVLGVAWSVLNPVLMMLILTAVFSGLFRIGDALQYPFSLYVITGQLLYSFYTEATTSANYAIVSNAQIMKKVYIPKYIFPLEKVLFAFVNVSFSMIAVVVMLVIFRIPFTWSMLLAPVPMILLLIFCTGVGLILSSISVFFRDMNHLYGIITMALMYLTPVIYPISTVDGRWIRYVVYANPLTWYIEFFRKLLFFNQTAELLSISSMSLVCAGWALLMLCLGLLVIWKMQDKFILHV